MYLLLFKSRGLLRFLEITTFGTYRPEITMNINNATICPEITRIRLVQNLISHLVDNYPRSRMLRKTPRDHYFCSCHAPRSQHLENNAKRVRNTAPRPPDLDLECTCYCLSREAYSDSSRSPHLGHTRGIWKCSWFRVIPWVRQWVSGSNVESRWSRGIGISEVVISGRLKSRWWFRGVDRRSGDFRGYFYFVVISGYSPIFIFGLPEANPKGSKYV